MDTDENTAATNRWDQHLYHVLMGMAIALVTTGTIVYRILEDWSWVDSLYFSVVTVTTVGFGDLAPTTDGSKLFTILYILSGITIITTFLNARFKVRITRRRSNAVDDTE